MSNIQCECHTCIEKYNLKAGLGEDWLSNLPLNAIKMIVCINCGNKRCPKASNHELACTNSNEPGQVGSIY